MSEENTKPAKGRFYAKKSFLDGNQKFIKHGQPINPNDYDDQTMTHYHRRGMVGPAETKPAAPAETKKTKAPAPAGEGKVE